MCNTAMYMYMKHPPTQVSHEKLLLSSLIWISPSISNRRHVTVPTFRRSPFPSCPHADYFGHPIRIHPAAHNRFLFESSLGSQSFHEPSFFFNPLSFSFFRGTDPLRLILS